MELLYGFRDLKDVVNERVVGDRIPTVTAAIDRTIAEHNRVTDIMMNLFVRKTTEYKVRYKTRGAARLSGLDEYGRARKVKSYGQYEVGFPLKDAGIALGDTRIALVKKTVREVNDDLAMLLQADKRWLRDNIMAALFDNVGYTFEDEEHGQLAVKGLANNDSTKYLIRAGANAGETANHYLGISAMDDENQNFSTIYSLLKKRVENEGNGKVITMVASDLRDDIENLTSFIEYGDPDITQGIASDRLTGRLDVAVPGEVFGKVDKNWLVEWESLPSGYMVSVITSGEPPLAMREHPEPELQGFNRVASRDDDPYYESQFVRIAGFGAWNRVGAVVTKVDDGSYSVPSGYAQPLP